MSYRLTHAASLSAAKGTAQHILMLLADCANDHEVIEEGNTFKATCFPSQDYLAQRSGYGVSTVKRALKTLKEQGFISYDGRRGKVAHYALSLPKIVQNELTEIVQNELSKKSKMDYEDSPKWSNQIVQNGLIKENTKREEEKRTETEDTSAGKENKEKRSTTAAEDASVVSFPSFPSSQQKPPVDLSLEAVQAATIDRLCENGSVPDRARRGVEANVSLYEIKFDRLQKTGELAKKNAPFRYLVASYAGIVEDWFKKDRTLEEVLADMRIEMGHVYPEHRALLARILTPDALPGAVGESLRIKAELDWFGVTDPYTYPFKALANWVAREVEEEEARQVEAEEAALAERVA